jgi:hypothetical protein
VENPQQPLFGDDEIAIDEILLLPNTCEMCYNRHATGMCSGQRLLCAFNRVRVCGIENEFAGQESPPTLPLSYCALAHMVVVRSSRQIRSI